MTATATKEKEIVYTEPCSVSSPDRKLSCDLQQGHPGAHTSKELSAVAWQSRKWLENHSPADVEPEPEKKSILDRLSDAWGIIVPGTIALMSRPVSLDDDVARVTVECDTVSVKNQVGYLEAEIIEALNQFGKDAWSIEFRIKGDVDPIEPEDPDAERAAEFEGREGEVPATVDGQPARLVLDGKTGAPIEDDRQPLLVGRDIRAIEQQLARVNAELLEAATEKKDAADRFKETQNRQNAVVAELVRAINGEQQLPFTDALQATNEKAKSAVAEAARLGAAAIDAAGDEDEDETETVDVIDGLVADAAADHARENHRPVKVVVDTGKEPGETDLSGADD